MLVPRNWISKHFAGAWDSLWNSWQISVLLQASALCNHWEVPEWNMQRNPNHGVDFLHVFQEQSCEQAYQWRLWPHVPEIEVRNPRWVLRCFRDFEELLEQRSLYHWASRSLWGAFFKEIQVYFKTHQGEILRDPSNHHPERIVLPPYSFRALPHLTKRVQQAQYFYRQVAWKYGPVIGVHFGLHHHQVIDSHEGVWPKDQQEHHQRHDYRQLRSLLQRKF